MKIASLALALSFALVTPPAPAGATPAPQPSQSRIQAMVSDGRTYRSVLISGPDAPITLRSGETMVVSYAYGDEAVYVGPFNGTLNQAQRREVESQSFFGRIRASLRQSILTSARMGIRSDAEDEYVQRPEVADLDRLPPIGVKVDYPQCVARGERLRLWREPGRPGQTFAITYEGGSSSVTFEADEQIVEWPIARPETLAGRELRLEPARPYGSTTISIVAVDRVPAAAMYGVLSDAGCRNQAEAVMDYLLIHPE
mgnify:CR=1 FL=1